MKNIIKFHPYSEETLQFAEPPQPATRFVPDWYKRQPGVVNNDGLKYGQPGTTVKKCMPIFDAMTAGYIITAPCDIYLDATDPNKLTWSIPAALSHLKSDMFASHAFEQYSEYPLDPVRHHKTLFRVYPFWSVQTPKGYSTLFTQPYHSDPSSPLTALAGVVDTDNFISEGHLSFIVNKGFDGIIKQGTPLVQIIPFKRDEWESTVVPLEESKKITQEQHFKLRVTFFNGYKDKFRSKKEYK